MGVDDTFHKVVTSAASASRQTSSNMQVAAKGTTDIAQAANAVDESGAGRFARAGVNKPQNRRPNCRLKDISAPRFVAFSLQTARGMVTAESNSGYVNSRSGRNVDDSQYAARL